MERAGGGRRARASSGSRPTGRSRSSAARATTAATASSWRGCCARPGGRWRVVCVAAPEELAGRRRARTSSASRARDRCASTGARGREGQEAGERPFERAGRDRRRAARHRLQGEPHGASRRGDRGDRAGRRARGAASTCRAASTPRPGSSTAAAVRAAVTVTFHAAKPGLWIQPGQGARRRASRSPTSASRAVRRPSRASG